MISLSYVRKAACNLVWESWLGRLTDIAKEAVVNRNRAPPGFCCSSKSEDE
jgi:hypothetical protein